MGIEDDIFTFLILKIIKDRKDGKSQYLHPRYRKRFHLSLSEEERRRRVGYIPRRSLYVPS